MDVWKNYENLTHNIVLSFTGYQILDMVTVRELSAKLFDKLICYRDYVGGCEDRRCEDESPTDDSKKTSNPSVLTVESLKDVRLWGGEELYKV